MQDQKKVFSFFIHRKDELTAKLKPQLFKVLKISFLLTLIFESCLLFLDREILFSPEGLMYKTLSIPLWGMTPISGKNFYYVISSLLILQILLANISLFSRFQNKILAVLYFIYLVTSHNLGPFSHLGDSLVGVFLFILACTPTATWFGPSEKINVTYLDLFPISILIFIIYLQNFFLKLSTGWIFPNTFREILNHSEFFRFPEISSNLADLSPLLTYLALIVIALSAINPLISLNKFKIRRTIAILNIGYHVFALLMMKLGTMSFFMICLQIIFFINPDRDCIFNSNSEVTIKNNPSFQNYLALFFLMMGFYGSFPRDERTIFTTKGNPLYRHHWYMFAPIPTTSGTWKAVFIDEENSKNETILPDEEIKKEVGILNEHRSYKFFFQLRRPDSEPYRKNLMKLFCNNYFHKKGWIQLTFEYQENSESPMRTTHFSPYHCQI